MNCTLLEEIEIPDSTTSIASGLFCGCSGLTEIDLHKDIETIGSQAFMGCKNLTKIIIRAIEPPTLADINAFTSTSNCPIYVPAGCVEAYKTAPNWSELAGRILPITQ